MRRMLCLVLLLGTASTVPAGSSAEIGAPVEAASHVAGTRIQMWPTAAWSEGGKCWLLAWREGDITEGESDIWCARVGTDGKALDPSGIKVCAAKGRQDRPRVASDGKDFMVVWEDFRNGKDYDVYAARVGADGKVLDADGLLAAGGAHNQCRAAVAPCSGSYFVAWQSYTGDGVPGDCTTGYGLRGVPLGPNGKATGQEVVLVAPAKRHNQAHAPILASSEEGMLMAYWAGGDRRTILKFVAFLRMNAAGRQMEEGASYLEQTADTDAVIPALAWARNGGLAAMSQYQGFRVLALDASGKPVGNAFIKTGGGIGPPPLISAASDGERYLVTVDLAAVKDRDSVQVKVHGLVVPDPGDLKGFTEKSLFIIAGDGANDQMQGFAAAGPKGVCLVANIEVRGADNTKVLARLVKLEKGGTK